MTSNPHNNILPTVGDNLELRLYGEYFNDSYEYNSITFDIVSQ